ncbi:endonuclease/exonuclease/phosphatase family protein [Streptosporangium canum]|uniref:endonuclease/exonuclease/phosphatase family protein n=1 Tax=Streptosporangium canum TaxID=324952 RepID=UPI0037A62F15
MTDATQGMLFGSLVPDATGDPAVGDEHQLRICALNVNSPSLSRAQRLADWLLSAKATVLVLSELRPSDGGRLLLNILAAEGFDVHCTPGWQTSPYLAAVASRGLSARSLTPQPFDPRIAAVDLSAAGGTVRVVGVYAPTNGMTSDSSRQRQAFQRSLLTYLTGIRTPDLCVAGDLNVVEPDHHPHLPDFAPHDYAFYTGLLDLDLIDAYRTLTPDGGDHSWLSDRYGRQRLDHTFISPHLGKVSVCTYDHTPRADRLTDHAALLTTIDLTCGGSQ